MPRVSPQSVGAGTCNNNECPAPWCAAQCSQWHTVDLRSGFGWPILTHLIFARVRFCYGSKQSIQSFTSPFTPHFSPFIAYCFDNRYLHGILPGRGLYLQPLETMSSLYPEQGQRVIRRNLCALYPCNLRELCVSLATPFFAINRNYSSYSAAPHCDGSAAIFSSLFSLLVPLWHSASFFSANDECQTTNARHAPLQLPLKTAGAPSSARSQSFPAPDTSTAAVPALSPWIPSTC